MKESRGVNPLLEGALGNFVPKPINGTSLNESAFIYKMQEARRKLINELRLEMGNSNPKTRAKAKEIAEGFGIPLDPILSERYLGDFELQEAKELTVGTGNKEEIENIAAKFAKIRNFYKE